MIEVNLVIVPCARITAACAALILVFQTGYAHATPEPRKEEWWFTSWQIPKVWQLTTGTGVTVAEVGFGVQANIPDLRGAVLKGGGAGFGLHGDGRTDQDGEKGGHGTGMAALIAAQGRGTGMMGVAPGAKILPVLSDTVVYDESIRFAVDHGAKVINISAGIEAPDCDSDLQQSVSYAIEHDAIVVASSGNDPKGDNSHVSPANCAGVLTVGGIDMRLHLYSDSTPGDRTAVVAPAVDIGSVGKAGIFGVTSGTSSAAALTSGALALLRSRFPREPGRRIVQRILYTARDIGHEGWDKYFGLGAVRPYSALTQDVPDGAPNLVYSRYDEWKRASDGPSSPSGSISPSPERRSSEQVVRKGQRGTTRILVESAVVVGLISIVLSPVLLRRFRRQAK